MKSVYYPWVDWAKTIGIFLVILGHGGLVDETIRQFIYSFHMPLFFMISGLLYKPVSFTITIKKYFHRLIIPYLIMNGACLTIVGLVAIKNGLFSLPFLLNRIGAIVIGLGYQYCDLIPVDTPTWFLVVLFYVYVFQSLTTNNRYIPLIASVLSIIIVFTFSAFNIDTCLPIDSALMSYPFFCFGLYMKDVVHKQIKEASCIIIFAFMLLCTLVLSLFNGRADINTCNYGNNILIYYICGGIGSLCVIFLCKLMRRVPCFVKVISSGTILILGFNLFAIDIAKRGYDLFFHHDVMSSWVGFVIAVVILVTFYPIIVFCSKHFHSIMGK